MRTCTLLAAVSLSALMATATPKDTKPQGSPRTMDKFITELMSRMTIEEKIGQLNLPVTGEITVGINPFRVKADNKGHLYVSSQGNYFDIPANLYVIDTQSNHVVDTLNIGASDFCIVGDTAYAYSSEWSNTTNAYTHTYHTIDLNTREVSPATFVTDGTPITSLYGMAVNPDTKEVYLTDAGDYTNSGTIFCFNPDGTLKWKADTGVSPAHFALKY